MLQVEEALAAILSSLSPLPSEPVPLEAACARFLAAPVSAPADLPRFDNSAMDGFALRADDLIQATPAQPIPLKVIAQVAAGEIHAGELQPGQCVRLFTGSPLPSGADAVVMQEDTRADPSDAQMIWFFERAKPWDNIRFRGEDVKRGESLLLPGERLTAGRVNLLAALGLTQLRVGRRPSVGLLATGSELVEPGEPVPPGKIYESNRLALASLAAQAGGRPVRYPLLIDEMKATESALTKALSECDLVVTSGGVSVGEFDLIKQAFESIGGELAFWKVAIKPGKPFVFGRWQDKCLFALPGNPVSAVVTFLLLVRPAILRLQGASDLNMPRHPGRLIEPLSNPGERRHYVRVVMDAEGQVRSAGIQASHILSSLAKANGLLDLPPKTSLPAGSIVQVLRWE